MSLSPDTLLRFTPPNPNPDHTNGHHMNILALRIIELFELVLSISFGALQ
jgi:hypothetical protein